MDSGHLKHAILDAEKLKRIPTTARWYWENLIQYNSVCWMWNADSRDCGLDPWIEIDGIDMLNDSSTWIFESISGKEYYGSENTIIFAQIKDLEKHNLIVPEIEV